MAAQDLAGNIGTTATNPATATVDGLSVSAQPIAAQIEADRYLAAKAARATRNRGLIFTKLLPAGAMPDSQGTGQGGNVNGFSGI